jgi:hypothetical protein
MLHPLSNIDSLLHLHTLLLSGLESAELVVFLSTCDAGRTDEECLCEPSFVEVTRRNQCSVENLKMSLVALIFLFIPGEWCVVHPILCDMK